MHNSRVLSQTALVSAFVVLFVTGLRAQNMVLYQEWDGGSRGGASTEAYFDITPLTRTGAESVQVTVFRVNFSVYPGWREAQIQLAVPPWPEKTILANYQDGAFVDLTSVSLGGNNSVAVQPPSNWLGENVSVSHNVLSDIPCCANSYQYTLKKYSAPSLVCDPSEAKIEYARFGDEVVLSWPNAQCWKLQAQINSLAVGLSDNWVDVLEATSPFTNKVDLSNSCVFYRLMNR